jgi:cell division protein FtsL
MNAAAKFLYHKTLSRHWVLASFFTRSHILLSVILFMIFMSAFSIIYITNATRDLHASLYTGSSEHNSLYAQEGQLILEKSTLGMQARVQRVAEQTLSMIIPGHQSVVMVHE